MAKTKSSNSQLNISPASSVENDQTITLSATGGNELFVLDQAGLDSVEEELSKKLSKGLDFLNDFSLNIFSYRDKVDNLDSVIANSPFGPVGRIPTLTMDDDGVLHGAFDIRGNETSAGGDQDPIEVCYFKAKAGGKVLLKKVVGKRLLTGTSVDAARSRVMDPTILNAGNGKLFILAGRWFSGSANWTKSGDTANAWSASLLLKSTNGGLDWTQNTIGKANAANQEGTHITVTNLPTNCKGFLGGVGPGIKHSSGKLIFAVQWTTGNGDCKTSLLICDNPDTNDMEWRFSSGNTGGVNYEPSIMELPGGEIVILCRSEDADAVVNGNTMKKAFITKDFGENITTYEPLNLKVGSTAGNGGGNRCQGALAGFTTKNGVFCSVLAQAQNTRDGDLGSTNEWGRNKITIYAADVNKSLVQPIEMLNYFSGLAPTSSGEASTTGTPFGGYNNIIYKQCKDGEYLIAIYEDKLGISIKNISHLIPRLELYCSSFVKDEEIKDFVRSEEITQIVNDGISTSAEPIVKGLVRSEVDYIGYTTIGPVSITDVKADMSSCDDAGSIIDARTGLKYPKCNTGTNKPFMSDTEVGAGLIAYFNRGKTSDELTGTTIKEASDDTDDTVLGLKLPITCSFEFKFMGADVNNQWPAIFRAYNKIEENSDKETGSRMFGVNVKSSVSTNNEIIFNPFAVNTTYANTFRLKNPAGTLFGETIHYVIVVKEDLNQLHYVNGIEINNTTAYSGETGTATNLPAPGVGFTSKNTTAKNIKRLDFGADSFEIKTCDIAFGNLKFYNKLMTAEEVSDLYERRKEYLQALKTNYKNGYVGAINELITNLNSNSNITENLLLSLNKDTIVRLPHSDKLVLNLNTDLLKLNTNYNGLIAGSWNSFINYKNLKNIFAVNGTGIKGEDDFLSVKNDSYTSNDFVLNKNNGYLYIGKNLKTAYIDIEEMGISLLESFTLQFKFKQMSAPASPWTVLFAIKAEKGRTSSTDSTVNTNSIRIENDVNAEANKLFFGGNGLSGGARIAGNVTGNNVETKVTFTYNAVTKDIKFYSDSNTPVGTDRFSSIFTLPFKSILLAPGGNGNTTYVDIELHSLRIWKGIDLTGDEVVTSLSI